jgi:hypothetical protein
MPRPGKLFHAVHRPQAAGSSGRSSQQHVLRGATAGKAEAGSPEAHHFNVRAAVASRHVRYRDRIQLAI